MSLYHLPATIIGYVVIAILIVCFCRTLWQILFGLYLAIFVVRPAWKEERRRFEEEKELGEFVDLHLAAKMLDISTDELRDMRSKGDIFGYRDGGSWKFKTREVQRILIERKNHE